MILVHLTIVQWRQLQQGLLRSGYWGWIRNEFPTFTMIPGEAPASVSFVMDTYNINWGHNDSFIDYNIAYRINGGSWTDLENSGIYLQNASKSFNLHH